MNLPGMMNFFRIFLPVLMFLLLPGRDAVADYITLINADKCETMVEIRIADGSIIVTFEIGEQDYHWFRNVIPLKYYREGYSETERGARLKMFCSHDFVVEADGRVLQGILIKTDKVQRTPRASLYTGQVDTSGRGSRVVVYVEMKYALPGRSSRLTFIPPLKEGYDITFANIGFVTFHQNIPVHDIRYLGRREMLTLDWKDPWYSQYENKNIRRHHKSSLMSFLYVDPYEVRHEILARVKDLEAWMEFSYGIGDVIPVEEQDSLQRRIADFLSMRNIVTVDGVAVKPIIDKIHFIEVNSYGIQVITESRPLDYSSVIIGVIFAYPNPGIPQEVLIDWDMFTDQITMVPNSATDPAGPMPYMLRPDDHVLTWKNYLKKYKLPTVAGIEVTNATFNLPILTLLGVLVLTVLLIKRGVKFQRWSGKERIVIAAVVLLALGGTLYRPPVTVPFVRQQVSSKPEAEKLFSSLLRNMYRAFDYREESDIYDKLALSIDGPLLPEVYLQTRKSMVIEKQGGIRAKVKDIEILHVEESESTGDDLAYECTWRVSGSVGHWGHIHQRTNQYRAIVGISPSERIWKLTSMDLIEEVRL